MAVYNIKLPEEKSADYLAGQIVQLLRVQERREGVSLHSIRGNIPASDSRSPHLHRLVSEYESRGPEIYEATEKLGRIHLATVSPKNQQPESDNCNQFEIRVLREDKITPTVIGELEKKVNACGISEK